ncbi:MAG TPA: acyltransferase [Bacteroidia bacterium]|jgi:peptidoglycan/LPS O-acetylase OafA/YrhL|nr:acyltransferase [Bacteroidia bacterium]
MLSDKTPIYLPHLNFWRGFAALAVCAYHFANFSAEQGPLFPGASVMINSVEYGRLGVFLFFVISAVVVPLSMHNKDYRLKNFFRFLLKRSIRIEPPYIGTIVLIFLIGFYLAHHWGYKYTIEPARFFLHIGYLIPFSHYDWYNIIFWTLAVEFQFYIAVALLYPLITNKNKIVQHCSLLIWFLPMYYFSATSALGTYSAAFLAGIAYFLLITKRFSPAEFFTWLIVAGVGMLYHRPLELAIAVMVSVAIVHFGRIRFRIGEALGEISYSLYLTHGCSGSTFLLLFTKNYFDTPTRYFYFLLSILIAIICAAAFWFVVERPSRKISQRLRLN